MSIKVIDEDFVYENYHFKIIFDSKDNSYGGNGTYKATCGEMKAQDSDLKSLKEAQIPIVVKQNKEFKLGNKYN
ncbi:hypothetical protein [Clostridium tyrobutyricum]|uniref:hypothetical protein n=1 Tax=Clostridium tyrobutyricum TaxID=1519 RepID=UPI00057DBA24|nr:hypothetical protein [Clostridium tyrobutyricum]